MDYNTKVKAGDEMKFRRAERKRAKLRLGIAGVAGSGKTYSALLIALGLGGNIAMIDTEHGSGELYASIGEYSVCTLAPPFTPDKYINAIKTAEKDGFDVIIIDSLSHAWAGEGGLLEYHGDIVEASKNKNSYMAWRKVTPLHNKLVESILQSSSHIIGTMRSKQEYSLQTDERGKTSPIKVGLAPIQRDGMEYEFTVFLDINQEHIATATKDRTTLFDGKPFKPTQETGKILLKWLNSGIKETPISNPKESSRKVDDDTKIKSGVSEVNSTSANGGESPAQVDKEQVQPSPPITQKQWEDLKNKWHGHNMKERVGATLGQYIKEVYGVKRGSGLTEKQYEEMKTIIEENGE